jgi:hypothetical protein
MDIFKYEGAHTGLVLSPSEGEITVVVSLNYCNIREVYVCTTSMYAFTTLIHNNKRRLARYHAM